MRATYPQSLIRREITRASAIFLIVAGAALAVTPIPLGAFMVAFGFAMLIPVSAYTRRKIRETRECYSWFDKAMTACSRPLPPGPRRIIDWTRPRSRVAVGN
ncbi:hypothetical protein GCM10011367_16710 [Marinicauda pacifica]|jgi:hypothetical protein|uniref:Uncharacterized protein n=1 Tax=Marinicauda pacifica TaxID=1133559 RepID=A0A4S2HBL7_9PROT|nr:MULTISPECIES: hypothetical protein [Marinicauda]TGY93078.1 hypothetical protein E5162_08430 [Marinicauda pacifica]GGE42609.1 hypothetical protein GCM10011367_16710 [Marinicauda pacifica]